MSKHLFTVFLTPCSQGKFQWGWRMRRRFSAVLEYFVFYSLASLSRLHSPPLECRPHWDLVTLCVPSPAHPPKISGTTPVKNMKIRLCFLYMQNYKTSYCNSSSVLFHFLLYCVIVIFLLFKGFLICQVGNWGYATNIKEKAVNKMGDTGSTNL